MLNSNGGYSLSDIAAATGMNGTNGNGMWNGDGAWWIIILFLFVFCGWGNNGWGNNRGGTDGSGAMDNYVLASDFSQLARQIDSGFDRVAQATNTINTGICDGFYAVNTSFGNLNTNLCNQFANVTNAITQNGYESRLATQNLSSQLADCCCKTQSAIADTNYNVAQNANAIEKSIADVNYNMATNTCAINNNLTTGFNTMQNSMCMNTRDTIDAINNSYRSLHDEIVANRIEDKNAQITAQQNEINALRLAASQQAQNAYLVSELRPSPIPAYMVSNPYYGNLAYSAYGCGCSCN